MKKKIVLIGGGQMGASIAHLCAIAGYEVYIQDISQKVLETCPGRVKENLKYYVINQILLQKDIDEALKRIHYTTDLKVCLDADLVIESVYENLELKKQVFRQLDQICQPETIFVSNTSSLSITAMGGVTNRGDKVIGLHFFSPVEEQPFVELIRGMNTSEETYHKICAFCGEIGKRHGDTKDVTGFIVNRLQAVMWNEALYMLMEGFAPADIDKAVTLNLGSTVGPIALTDMCGADVHLGMINGLWETYKDGKFRPCPLLVKAVESGNLGNKTGKGFLYGNK